MQPYDQVFVEALLASHRTLLGSSLVPAGVDAARWLYHDAPFAVLAHDQRDDPRFVYANLRAQHWFERPWSELVGMPSRLSAEAPDRAERAALLAQVALHGFTRDYRGVRVAASGKRFWIERAKLWNIHGLDGTRLGQAAAFSEVTPV
jgi:hypothetical protein